VLGRANIFGARVSLTRQGNDGDAPPPPFIMDGRHPEQPPRRAAQPISSADSGECSVAARWSWAALGLSSRRFVVAATASYIVFRPDLEIPHQSTGGVFWRLHRASSYA
jgi:hypothetical protein